MNNGVMCFNNNNNNYNNNNNDNNNNNNNNNNASIGLRENQSPPHVNLSDLDWRLIQDDEFFNTSRNDGMLEVHI